MAKVDPVYTPSEAIAYLVRAHDLTLSRDTLLAHDATLAPVRSAGGRRFYSGASLDGFARDRAAKAARRG